MRIHGATVRTAVVLLAVITAAGCFRRPSRNAAAASASRQIPVEVENNHWATVVVYVVVNGQGIRIGEVNTGATTVLRTPVGVDPSVVDFRIRVDPIGEREIFESRSLSVHGGSRVLLTVENDIRNSRIRVT
jgi:hypothetical protein